MIIIAMKDGIALADVSRDGDWLQDRHQGVAALSHRCDTAEIRELTRQRASGSTAGF